MPRSPLSAKAYAEVRARILKAARQIFETKGIDALSMRALASRVGLSAAALYRYFPGKGDVLAALWQEGVRALEARLDQISSAEPDAMRALAALAHTYADFARGDPDLYRLLFSINVETDDRMRDSDDTDFRTYRIVRERMAQAVAEGRVAPADPDLATQILWSAIHGALSLHLTCINFPLCDPGDLIGRAVDTVLRGLTADKGVVS